MKCRCLVALVCLLTPPATLLIVLLAPALAEGVREIFGAVAGGLSFVLYIAGGVLLLGAVVLLNERQRQQAQMAALAWELERVWATWEAAQARQRSQVVAERKALQESIVEGEYRRVA